MSGLPDESCDLIYADPPFNSNRRVVRQSNPAMHFEDRYDGGLSGYLDFLRPRIVQMHRLLAPSGTMYVHLDWRTAHYVKVMLDELFGAENFLNEIIWRYRSGGHPGRWFARKHDTILSYARCAGRHRFNQLRGEPYRTQDLLFDDDGRPYKSTRKGRVHFHRDGGVLSDVWDIPFLSTVSKERTSYPTQKPEALIERIVLASSNPGELIADFFCGSGTTLAVARRLGRRFLGCDDNPAAVDLTIRRLGLKPHEDSRL
jgi:site-specific DNA-methyltransferase (adenine-specific)